MYVKTKDGKIWTIYGEDGMNEKYICYPYNTDFTKARPIDYDDVVVIDSDPVFCANWHKDRYPPHPNFYK